eukprot:m.212755 g.212755  ORF g.212755 m.212755 type:complete len:1325 (+) comp17169_c0_seq1:217-4191(+)
MAAELRSRFKLSSKEGDHVNVEVLLLVSKSKSEPENCPTPAQFDKHFRVWCGLDTGNVEIYAPGCAKREAILALHSQLVTSLIQVGNCVWSASFDSSVVLVDARTRRVKAELTEHKDAVVALLKSGSHHVWSASLDGHIICWDASSECAPVIERDMRLPNHSKSLHVHAMEQGDNNTLWIGTGTSILILDQTSLSTLYRLPLSFSPVIKPEPIVVPTSSRASSSDFSDAHSSASSRRGSSVSSSRRSARSSTSSLLSTASTTSRTNVLVTPPKAIEQIVQPPGRLLATTAAPERTDPKSSPQLHRNPFNKSRRQRADSDGSIRPGPRAQQLLHQLSALGTGLPGPLERRTTVSGHLSSVRSTRGPSPTLRNTPRLRSTSPSLRQTYTPTGSRPAPEPLSFPDAADGPTMAHPTFLDRMRSASQAQQREAGQGRMPAAFRLPTDDDQPTRLRSGSLKSGFTPGLRTSPNTTTPTVTKPVLRNAKSASPKLLDSGYLSTYDKDQSATMAARSLWEAKQASADEADDLQDLLGVSELQTPGPAPDADLGTTTPSAYSLNPPELDLADTATPTQSLVSRQDQKQAAQHHRVRVMHGFHGGGAANLSPTDQPSFYRQGAHLKGGACPTPPSSLGQHSFSSRWRAVPIAGTPPHSERTLAAAAHCMTRGLGDDMWTGSESMGQVQIWSCSEQQLRWEVRVDCGGVVCLALHRQRMWAGCSNSSMLIWNAITYEPLQEVIGHADAVRGLTSKYNFVLSCGGLGDSQVALWSALGRGQRLPLAHLVVAAEPGALRKTPKKMTLSFTAYNRHGFTLATTVAEMEADRLQEDVEDGHGESGSTASFKERVQREAQWQQLLLNSPTTEDLLTNVALPSMLHAGTPHQFRVSIWSLLLNNWIGQARQATGSQHYVDLVKKGWGDSDPQIRLDLPRTFPHNRFFSHKQTRGIKSLRRVLNAFSWHNQRIKYCQGFNFLAAFWLLFVPEEMCFWGLVAIVEHIMPSGYYVHPMIDPRADQRVMVDLVQHYLPKLAHRLAQSEMDLSLITFQWFFALFVDMVDTELTLRIWDCLLLEGRSALFKFSLALLKLREDELCEIEDRGELFSSLKQLGVNVHNNTDDIVRLAMTFPLTADDMEAQFETHCEGLEGEERSRAVEVQQLLTKRGKGDLASPPEHKATPPVPGLDDADMVFSPVPPVPFSYGGPNAAALIAQALQARAELFPAENSSFGPVSNYSDGAASMLQTATSALDSYRHTLPHHLVDEEGSSPPQGGVSTGDASIDSWDDVSQWQPNQTPLVDGHHRQRRRRLSSSEGFLDASALGLSNDDADDLLPDLDV